MKLLIIAVVFIWAMILAYFIGDYLGVRSQLEHARADYVYSVCIQAHHEVSGRSEQARGELQNETGYEFMCNKTNTHCWVEKSK